MFPKVHIIVLTWNQRDLIFDCLASLHHLDYPNYSVIVVDNASCDQTANAIRTNFPGATLIENSENLGFAEGNNVGIRYALEHGAEYVMLLNDDTLVDAPMLAELIAVAGADSEIGMVGPAIYYQNRPEVIWSAGNRIDWRTGALERVHADERIDSDLAPFIVDYLTGCALCMKSTAIKKIGVLDPRYFIYYEETDWCTRARAAGYRAVVVPRSRIWHKVSATIKQDSPATTYYMTRNLFRFLARNSRGKVRLRVFTLALLRELRTVLAHTIKPRYRHLRAQRNARLLALRDVALGRWGKMGNDVALACGETDSLTEKI